MIEKERTYFDSEDLESSILRKEARGQITCIILFLTIFVVFIICLLIGPSTLSASSAFDALIGNGTWKGHYIVFNLRMPRSICAMAVGAGLAIAGMAMQAMFRNPMASPSVLGLSSGASFGASLAIAFGFGGFIGAFSVSFMAFISCFITMCLVYALAITRYGTPTVLLLLSGVAVGALFSGLTSFIQYVVEPDILQGVVYWTMGSFSRCHWEDVRIGIPVIILGILLICTKLKELNLISLGEEQAESLGVNIKRTRGFLLIGTALCVGGSVAISGIIGFVGLIIPHICRAIAGPNHLLLAPLCILTGAIFMMIMDIVAKSITFTGELPIGILTSILGAPFFIYIMRKKRNELWG